MLEHDEQRKAVILVHGPPKDGKGHEEVQLVGGKDEDADVGGDAKGGQKLEQLLQRADVLSTAVRRPLRVVQEQVGIASQPPQVVEEDDCRTHGEGRREEHNVADLQDERLVPVRVPLNSGW